MTAVLCPRCKLPRGRARAHGQLCKPCYGIRFAPRTNTGLGGKGIPKGRDVVVGRLENVAELAAQDEDIRMIAARLGVSVRTVYRYQARARSAA